VQPPLAVCAAFSNTERLDADAVAANRPTHIGIVPNLHAICVRYGKQVKLAIKAQATPSQALKKAQAGEIVLLSGDYTPRIVPHHPAAAVPLEATQILWQR
jgi:hypothetical protein